MSRRLGNVELRHRFTAFLLSVLLPVCGWSLPTGERVQHGNVQFIREGNRLLIEQATPRAIVNYSQFGIAPGEAVQFRQPGSGAAILNRVTGGSASTIAGQLTANGQVYLINPSGILFAPGSQVSVHGLVASAMQMSDASFLSGRLQFHGPGGRVVNQGNISAAYAYLIGGSVRNGGQISAREVVLAAGQQSVLIDRAGPGGITVIIDGKMQEQSPDGTETPPADSPNEAQTDETGESETEAPAGQQNAFTSSESTETGTPVESAELPTDAVSNADLSSSGTGPAPQAENSEPIPGMDERRAAAPLDPEGDPPAPSLLNPAPGDVVNTGVVDAQGDDGGSVDVSGTRVAQQGVVTADGLLGAGGEIRLIADKVVEFGVQSVTRADAGLLGDGGSITILAGDRTLVPAGAVVSARGGLEGGAGGQVEVSADRVVSLRTPVQVEAPRGQAGILLIDPTDIVIDDVATSSGGSFSDGPAFSWNPSGSSSLIDVDELRTQLGLGQVRLETASAFSGNGDITLNTDLDFDGLGSTVLTLEKTPIATSFLPEPFWTACRAETLCRFPWRLSAIFYSGGQ